MGAGCVGSDDSESTLGDFKRGLGLRMKTTFGIIPPAPAELKNPELDVVGVEEVSSLSDMQRGLELPLLLGPENK